MAKLHEVLAVENSLESTAKKLIAESEKTLTKDTLFLGQERKLVIFRDEDKEAEHTEAHALDSTVDENLEYINPHIGKWLDTVLSKEEANQRATGDIQLDGAVFIAGLPATFLLGLETKLMAYRKLCDKIPTLPPGTHWMIDGQERPGVYKTEVIPSLKTEKEESFKEVSPATEHHPAQVVKLDRTVNVGRYDTIKKCGMMPASRKAEILTRIDELTRAVKQARQRANECEVKHERVGDSIMNYIMNGTT